MVVLFVERDSRKKRDPQGQAVNQGTVMHPKWCLPGELGHSQRRCVLQGVLERKCSLTPGGASGLPHVLTFEADGWGASLVGHLMPGCVWSR